MTATHLALVGDAPEHGDGLAGRSDDARPAWATGRRTLGFGVAGDRVTRLLAGPPARAGRESLAAHLARLGPLEAIGGAQVRDLARRCGVTGRGGGEFPLAVKLDTAAESAPHNGRPIVVVNASEGEPASRKDRTLLELRPHLVLDGAVTAARAVEAREVVLYVHRSRAASAASLEAALAERAASGSRHGPEPTFRIVDAPDRYVAGEANAVTAYLDHGQAFPGRRRIPVAARGVHGRPTVVSNAETYAHLGLIVRHGAEWFHGAGSKRSPGSTLVTLTGGVTSPGLVVEVVGPTTFAELLGGAGGLSAPPRALLLGGYAGTWIAGADAWSAPVERGALSLAGARLGCGLVGVLPSTSCGISETLRLADYLAGQSAGQCGPCVLGLPAMADLLRTLEEGAGLRRDVRRLRHLAASIRGRGACALPDGAVTLIETALDVFAEEVALHRKTGRCGSSRLDSPFPLPSDRAKEVRK